MSSITFSCPDCGGLLRVSLDAESVSTRCPQCDRDRQLQELEFDGGYLKRCIVCPSKELFVRKDFPQRLGVAIVIAGFVVSSVFWAYHNVMMTFAVLFLTTLVDIALYLTMGNVLECYRCHAQYRGLAGFDDYGQFDLETYEKHRQQALRLEEVHQVAEFREAASN